MNLEWLGYSNIMTTDNMQTYMHVNIVTFLRGQSYDTVSIALQYEYW